MSGRTVGIITPPWLTESGQPETTQIDIDGEGAAVRLAEAAGMTIEAAAEYLEFLSAGRAKYEESCERGGVA